MSRNNIKYPALSYEHSGNLSLLIIGLWQKKKESLRKNREITVSPYRRARKWIKQQRGDKEPLEVINNLNSDYGNPNISAYLNYYLQAATSTWRHALSSLQSRLILIVHLSKHVCLFRWNQITLKQPRGACACERRLNTISWLDWEKETKLSQINNNKKPAVSSCEELVKSNKKQNKKPACSNVKHFIDDSVEIIYSILENAWWKFKMLIMSVTDFWLHNRPLWMAVGIFFSFFLVTETSVQ